jgi:hypothetical protein
LSPGTELNKAAFRVFLNPATTDLTIVFSQDNVTIRLADALGKEVNHFSFSGDQFMLEQETAGLYYLSVTDRSGAMIGVQKVIIR